MIARHKGSYHSEGGRVAMQLALDRPELVSSLVVVDVAPKSLQKGTLQEQMRIIQAMKELGTPAPLVFGFF
jgi:pimeloyl-ACP methyl ester carboxylesterase